MRFHHAITAVAVLASAAAAGCTEAQFTSVNQSFKQVKVSSMAVEATALPLAAAASTSLATMQLLTAMAEGSEKNAGVIAAGGANVIAAGGANYATLAETTRQAGGGGTGDLGTTTATPSGSSVDYANKTGKVFHAIGGKTWVDATYAFDYAYDRSTGKLNYTLKDFKGNAGGFDIAFGGDFELLPTAFPRPMPANAKVNLTGTMTHKDQVMTLETLTFDVAAPLGGDNPNAGKLVFSHGKLKFTCELGLKGGLPDMKVSYQDTSKPDSAPVPVDFNSGSFFSAK
jgi:hypothetical protein